MRGPKYDVPEVVVDFLESDVLASQSLSDVDPLAVSADSAVAADEADLVMGGVIDRGKLGRHFSRRRVVPGGGRVLVEGFVRTVLVVLLSELVEAPLLAGLVPARRTCGLGLQSSVHPFVSSVLLGVGRLDQLGVDAQADPPDRQQRQPAKRPPASYRSIHLYPVFRLIPYRSQSSETLSSSRR